MTAKEIAKQNLLNELAEINTKIDNFIDNHTNINGFIHNCETLRKLKQHKRGIENALNSGIFN